MTGTLAVVIVTYNSRREIDACLESVLRSGSTVRATVTVVDNASTDGTADAVRRRWPAVHVIDAGANVGFARANNLGIRSSTGPLVLLLNPDTAVSEGALDVLVGVLERRPEAAAVGPRLVDEQGRAELSFGSMLSPLAELRQKLLTSGHRHGLPLIRSHVERLTLAPREVDWVSGACLLVRRRDAESVGLFDERYVMYIEDVDFCAALRSRGRTVLFEPRAVVTHARGRSAASAAAATRTAYRRSQLAFYEKHRSAWVPLLRGYLRLKGELPPD